MNLTLSVPLLQNCSREVIIPGGQIRIQSDVSRKLFIRETYGKKHITKIVKRRPWKILLDFQDKNHEICTEHNRETLFWSLLVVESKRTKCQNSNASPANTFYWHNCNQWCTAKKSLLKNLQKYLPQ